jgi:hypothetical protein
MIIAAKKQQMNQDFSLALFLKFWYVEKTILMSNKMRREIIVTFV